MVIKTLSLKLYQPTKYKKQLLDDALLRYSVAFQRLLSEMQPRVQGASPQATKNYFLKQIGSDILKTLDEYNVEPFKDSLKMDAAMVLATYCARLQAGRKVSYPVTCLDDHGLKGYIEQVAWSEGQDHWAAIDKAFEKYEKPRSILFSRYDVKRDYCLLYDETKNRYYAKLYLFNRKNALTGRDKLAARHSTLRYISPNGELYQSEGKMRYILVPLAFGKWQEGYLRQALEEPDLLRSAVLLRRNGAYYLDIKMTCKCQPPIRTVSYLSVTRSLKGSIGIGVYPQGGGDALLSTTLNQTGEGDAKLHLLANEVISRALQYHARIILYNLTKRYDRIEFTKPAQMSIGEYNALCTKILYKAELAGLPEPVLVSPNGTFYTCPVCNKNALKNRRSDELFICTKCGYSALTEELGRKNLAMRLERYRKNRVLFTADVVDNHIVYRNPMIDFCFESPIDEYASTRFRVFLSEYLAQFQPRDTRQASVIKKLTAAEDLTQIISVKRV